MGHTGPLDLNQSIGSASLGTRPLFNWEPVNGKPWVNGGLVAGYTKVVKKRPESRHNPVKAFGWRDPSDYYYIHEVNVAPKVGIKTRDSYGHGTERHPVQSAWINSIPTVWPIPGWVANMALIKARNDLRENNAQLGVAFLERMKTSNMVFGAMVDIVNTIKDFKRIHPKSLVNEVWRNQGRKDWYRRLSRRAKPVADRWLEVQYGWIPTMMDIDNSSNALARLESGYGDVQAFFVSAKKSHVDRSSFGERGPDWLFTGNTNWRLQTRVNVKRGATVRLDYVVSSPSVVALSELGLINPLSVAWEVLPYSFIVDWAWPIGPWAESLDATAGMTFRGGSVTEWVEYSRTTTTPFAYDGNYSRVKFFPERNGYQRVKRMRRLVYSTSPVPYPPLPAQGAFLKAGKRAQNALALLTSALGRR